MLGTGFSDFRSRATPAFFAALFLLVAAFAADTWSTALAGETARLTDFNPLVRGLSPLGYLASAAVRLLGAALLLVWFWPGPLEPRGSSFSLFFLGPFAFRGIRSYFGAVLVMAAVPPKLLAAVSNLAVAEGGPPLFSVSSAGLFGLAVGLVAASALLRWHLASLQGARKAR